MTPSLSKLYPDLRLDDDFSDNYGKCTREEKESLLEILEVCNQAVSICKVNTNIVKIFRIRKLLKSLSLYTLYRNHTGVYNQYKPPVSDNLVKRIDDALFKKDLTTVMTVYLTKKMDGGSAVYEARFTPRSRMDLLRRFPNINGLVDVETLLGVLQRSNNKCFFLYWLENLNTYVDNIGVMQQHVAIAEISIKEVAIWKAILYDVRKNGGQCLDVLLRMIQASESRRNTQFRRSVKVDARYKYKRIYKEHHEHLILLKELGALKHFYTWLEIRPARRVRGTWGADRYIVHANVDEETGGDAAGGDGE